MFLKPNKILNLLNLMYKRNLCWLTREKGLIEITKNLQVFPQSSSGTRLIYMDARVVLDNLIL